MEWANLTRSVLLSPPDSGPCGSRGDGNFMEIDKTSLKGYKVHLDWGCWTVKAIDFQVHDLARSQKHMMFQTLPSFSPRKTSSSTHGYARGGNNCQIQKAFKTHYCKGTHTPLVRDCLPRCVFFRVCVFIAIASQRADDPLNTVRIWLLS